MENLNIQTHSGRSIYTLVQSETKVKFSGEQLPILVGGKGTELKYNKTIQNRAKRKLITQKTILALVDVAKKRGASDREKAYWNTYHCMNRVYSANGRLYGSYCKNRFCITCCGIRKAELIKKYKTEVQRWEEPYFLTLTVKSQPAYRLSKIVNEMMGGFRTIVARYRKKSQRGKGPKLKGLKSLECNFNPDRKTYNPHFHLIVPDKQTAEILIEEWLNYWPKGFVTREAQYLRPVRNSEDDLIEVIKYSSKTFTEPDQKSKRGRKSNPFIYAAALDTIYAALKGHRIYERFGFNLPKVEKYQAKQPEKVDDYNEWNYNLLLGDWAHKEWELTLSDYSPPEQLLNLLQYNIDRELE